MIKYTFNTFTPFEPDYLCERLEKQARRGWFPEKIGKTLIKYRKDTPREILYRLAAPADRLEPELWTSRGWQEVPCKTDYSVFCSSTARSAPEDVRTKEWMAAYCETQRKRSFGSFGLFFICILRAYDTWRWFTFNPLSYLSNDEHLAVMLLNALLLSAFLLVYLGYGIWYLRRKLGDRSPKDWVQRIGLRGGLVVFLLITTTLLLCSLQNTPDPLRPYESAPLRAVEAAPDLFAAPEEDLTFTSTPLASRLVYSASEDGAYWEYQIAVIPSDLLRNFAYKKLNASFISGGNRSAWLYEDRIIEIRHNLPNTQAHLDVLQSVDLDQYK